MTQIEGVNARLTPRCGGAATFLWIVPPPSVDLTPHRLTAA